MSILIDLRSDTVTKPSQAMLEHMFRAEVGDDVFKSDPTISALEEKAANMFNMEAALFCPSGTMTNQIALQLHCGRLEEVLCDYTAHIYQYETGGYAHNGAIAINPVQTENGKLKADQISELVKDDFDWLPKTTLLSIENTCNRAGGITYSLNEMRALKQAAETNNLKYHLDGARIFNAIVKHDIDPILIGNLFDTISICLSKGLGAPVGSLLLGSKSDIYLARRLRKVMGGGMRQAGYLAAAGIYALDNNIKRLQDDHDKANQLAATLSELSWVKTIKPYETNIIIFQVDGYSAEEFTNKMKECGILCAGMSKTWVRFVTHMDVSQNDIDLVCERLKKL